jgi:hypothetical protein
MSHWPAFEKDEIPLHYPATERESSWLLPQSLGSLADELAGDVTGEWSGERAGDHEVNTNRASNRWLLWIRSVSGLNRPH